MGRAQGKAASITGVVRGQGRGHAGRLARESAGALAGGLAHGTAAFKCSLATPDGMEETGRPAAVAPEEAMTSGDCPGTASSPASRTRMGNDETS